MSEGGTGRRGSASGDAETAARRAIETVLGRFPELASHNNPGDPVELSVTIPVQTGVRYEVWLAHQNGDELHFSVGHFWLQWYPCTEPERCQAFVDAVSGYLAGDFRVVEYLRLGRCFKAELQAPAGEDWKCIGTTKRLALPLGPVRSRVLWSR